MVDQGDVLVALHQIRLGEIGDPQRLAGAKLLSHLHSDRAIAHRGVAATSAFGRRSVITSEDFRTSLRSTSRVSTAASTVSTAVPVKRSLVGAVPVIVADFEADIEAAAARIEPGRDRLHRAGVRRLQPEVLHVAVEGQA